MTLHDLGWRDDVADQVPPHDAHLRPARVTRQQRDRWRVHDGDGERVVAARTLPAPPVTGDWVLLDGDVIVRLLPRRTTLSRAEAGGRSREQVIAANIDIVAVCAPADAVNVRRLERELAAAWTSGAQPVVILTKADLVDDLDEVVETTAAVCVGVEVLPVASPTGEGVADVLERLSSGLSLALIGPSGVGKSSLLNALAGEPVMPTAAIRADGKGRHTTTTRDLVLLPTGGLVLDTPGMREFSPWLADGEEDVFGDLAELAAQCRFADCRHDTEPGCAVLIAAAADEEVGRRLAAHRRLQREQAWLERRHDARLMQQERRRWAAISREVRDRTRP